MSPCVRYGGAIAAVASMPGEPLQISDMHLLILARSGRNSRIRDVPIWLYVLAWLRFWECPLDSRGHRPRARSPS